MKKLVMMAFSFVCLFSVSGCATLFGSGNRSVHVVSNVRGAKVEYNGTDVGASPTDFTIGSPFGTHNVRLSAQGYYPQMKSVQTHFQMIGLLNILFWPGFIVDAISGDMLRVDPTLHFSLQKMDSPRQASSLKKAS